MKEHSTAYNTGHKQFKCACEPLQWATIHPSLYVRLSQNKTGVLSNWGSDVINSSLSVSEAPWRSPTVELL